MGPALLIRRLACFAALLGSAAAYYVPGTYPQEFWPEDVIQGALGGRPGCRSVAGAPAHRPRRQGA